MANKVSLKYDSIQDLRSALQRLPQELHDTAFDIMESEIHAAKADIEAAYPTGPTGNLKRGLKITQQTGLFRTAMTLKNTAPHAWIFEHGTKARHYFTKRRNVKHPTGAMPAGNVFIPRMITHRQRFYDRIADLLTEHGLLVRGRAA